MGGYTVPMRPPPPTGLAPDGRPLANAGIRLVAQLIDNVLNIVVMIVILAAVAGGLALVLDGSGSTQSDETSALEALAGVGIALGLVAVIFGVPCLNAVAYAGRHNGRSVGKQIMKIAVTPLEPGRPLSRGMLVKRWLMKDVLFGTLSVIYIGYLDFLWLLWDKPYQQCLHDKAAKTIVVKSG